MSLTLTKGGGFTTEFSPISVGNLKAWYKSDTGITLNGSTVSQWNDQSGNSKNLIQATAANQLTYVSNAINGYPALQFDGVNDLMTLAVPYSGNTFNELTFFVVTARSTNPSNNFILFSSATDYMYWNQPTNFRVGDTSLADTMSNNVYYIKAATASVSGNQVKYYSNGVNIGTNNSPVNTNWREFSGIGSSYGYPKGFIVEILIYNKILNPAEFGNVSALLSGKYNII